MILSLLEEPALLKHADIMVQEVEGIAKLLSEIAVLL